MEKPERVGQYESILTPEQKAISWHIYALKDYQSPDIFHEIMEAINNKIIDAMAICNLNDRIEDVIFFAIRESTSEILEILTKKR